MTILSIKIIIALSLRFNSPRAVREVFLFAFFSLTRRDLMALSTALATRHLGTRPSSVLVVRANCTKAHGIAEMMLPDWGQGPASA